VCVGSCKTWSEGGVSGLCQTKSSGHNMGLVAHRQTDRQTDSTVTHTEYAVRSMS